MGVYLKEYIVHIGVFLTFLATILGYIATRRNIKTTKFIDVVTTERIKWLSIIRNEISELVSTIMETLAAYEKEIERIEHEHPTEETMMDANYEFQMYYFDSTTESAFQENELPKHKDLLSRLILLKLRFNPNEDKKTLELIDFFLDFYASKYKSKNDLKLASEKINKLLNEIQAMLKKEWEKVKKESKGK